MSQYYFATAGGSNHRISSFPPCFVHVIYVLFVHSLFFHIIDYNSILSHLCTLLLPGKCYPKHEIDKKMIEEKGEAGLLILEENERTC